MKRDNATDATDANCEMDQWPLDGRALWHCILVGVGIILAIGTVVALAVMCGGCASSKPAKPNTVHPFPSFLDPVTETVPNVRR